MEDNTNKAVLTKCTHCKHEMSQPLLCDHCETLNPLPSFMDFFQLMGLPRRFEIDLKTLHEKYITLSRHSHPDFHAEDEPDVMALAMTVAAAVNEAYRTLSDPIRRAGYLLELLGGPASAQDKSVPVVLSMNNDLFFWSDVQQEAGIYRFQAGFFLWRLGAKGGIYGPWSLAWRDPYNPCDGHVGEWGDFCTPASSAQQPAFNSTLILEGLREGITDYRYVAMLERLIKEKPGTPAAQEGQAHLQKLRDQIQPEASHYFQGVGLNKAGGWDNTWTQKDTAWKGQDYDQQRRELVRRISALVQEGGK